MKKYDINITEDAPLTLPFYVYKKKTADTFRYQRSKLF